MANSTTVTADGVQTDFSVTFPFLDRAHVKVRLSGVLQSPPAYSWITASSIRFATAPAYGTLVYISRETPLTPVTDFSDGATLDANSLDRALRQPLYLVEDLETGDTSIEAGAILADAYAYTDNRELAIRADMALIGGGSSSATGVSLVDAGNYFSGGNVEAAMQEVGATLNGLASPSYLVYGLSSALPNERRLVQGTGISITDGGPGGDLVIASTGGGGGSVTSVGAIPSGAGISITGSPITSTGTFTFSLSANLQAWSSVGPTTKVDVSSLAGASGSTLVGFTAATAAPLRTAQDKLRDYISVKDYGAVGNGVTNDRTSIVNADAAAYAAGKVLFFPAGTYMVGAHITGLKASWVGEAGTTVKATTGVTLNTEALLTWSTVDDFVVRDIAFDLQSRPVTVGSEAVVAFINCGGFEVSHCRVLNLTGSGIAVNGGQRFTIRDCFISKSSASTTFNQAILVSSSARQSREMWLTNNRLLNSAINVSCVDGWIVGNYISGWGFGAGVTTEQDTNNSSRYRIINNVIEDSLTSIDVNGYRPGGIENWGPYSVISGNHIANCAGSGIDQGGQYSVVRDNIILNNGTSGSDNTPGPQSAGGDGIVSRYGNATYHGSNSIIAHNYVADTRAAGDKVQGYGYADQSASITGIHLYGNRYNGNWTGDENLLGTAAWQSRALTSGNFRHSGNGTVEFTCPVSFTNTVSMGGAFSAGSTITAGTDVIVASGNRVKLQGSANLTGIRYSSPNVDIFVGPSYAAGFGANTVGFCGTTPVTRPTITGSRGGNAALASLLTALASTGLITDSTTA